MAEALAWVAGQAELGEGEWSAAYLGDGESTADTILRQMLIGEEDAGGSRDVFAVLAGQQRAAAGMVLLDAQRLLGTKGVQAYCLACPSPARAAAQAERSVDGFFAKLAAFFGG